ncbi:MAG: nucleoside triphosphate pyrophosphohydrolase [Pseudomonadota bacterium]
MSLIPIQAVLKVLSDGIHTLPPIEVSHNSVGEKAFGIACLPSAWTLPFFVISSDLLSEYRAAKNTTRSNIIKAWTIHALVAGVQVGLSENSPVLVRSSAVSEPLENRGTYYSISGTLSRLDQAIENCLSQIVSDVDLQDAAIYLIVQLELNPISAKGHLSNERRCYKEARDWYGEVEDSKLGGRGFTVNLRRWRKEEKTDTESQPLLCNLRPSISKVLRIPAWWGYRQGIRLHFEWVWDGHQISIVQVDQAKQQSGENPTSSPDLSRRPKARYKPKCLISINADHASKYNKVKNVFTYQELGLPTTDLYVLDNAEILELIRIGQPPTEFVEDIKALVINSLVIRTDLATNDKHKRQLLPRTNEVQNVSKAIEFLQQTIETIHADNITDQLAFIFHNFIPAVASAFAYAAPGQRKVLIEALWGLPEGLYYNAHDKIEVDTQLASIENPNPDLSAFISTKKPHFKRYFVAPEMSGNWVTKNIGEPWDWRLSIQKENWIRQIAWDTRRIAESEGHSVSVMWFVGVPRWRSDNPVFPWYHESFDFEKIGRPRTHRTKTPFDKSLRIQTCADVDSLKESVDKNTTIRQIQIQPREDALLRDKCLLKKIGELAKQIDAVILLEGGTLSHVYYQLMQTQAIVEVVHPFDEIQEKQEFNKLVRDKIPNRISKGGEIVRMKKLTGDQLLQSLREKLVEEALETLDAKSHDAIIEELADVEEVIEGILKQLKASRRDLKSRQAAKHLKSGGFDQGYVLVDTSNPSPVKSESGDANLKIEFDEPHFAESMFIESNSYPIDQPILAKWTDRREHGATNERLLSLIVSLVRGAWTADSPEIVVGDAASELFRARVRGERHGSNLQLEISVFTLPRQLKLIK